jgi:DNA-binding beta-propeller fold protein YncE
MKRSIHPLSLGLALCLAACGGAGSSSSELPFAAPVSNAPAANGQAVTARVVIRIPARSTTRSTAGLSSRRPAYVSPATQSITVQVDNGKPTAQNLTSTSPNCGISEPLGALTCTVPIAAAAGSHTLTFVTYDEPGAVGNKLSANSVAATIVANRVNTVNLTLFGIPASLQVVPLTPTKAFAGSLTSGFAFSGGALPLLITALDADGNYIVGPGAPTLAVSVADTSAGSGIAVTAAGNRSPNEFTLASKGLGTARLAIVATPNVASAGSPLVVSAPLIAATLTTTIAGTPGTFGSTDGTGTGAQFFAPAGVAYDPTTSDLYVTDTDNCTVRQLTTAGVVTTLAGTAGTCFNFTDGTGSAAGFQYPGGITYDPGNGKLYITDNDNCAIRQITTAGAVTTIAGAGPFACAFADGTGTAANFQYPNGAAYDSHTGNLYIADSGNCVVRKLSTAGVVTTIAGNAGACSFADGTGTAAHFQYPNGIAYDPANGNLYVTDSFNCVVRQVTTTGVVTTVAGKAGTCSFADGTATGARLSGPKGIAYDPASGNLYVTDTDNCAIRQITTAGVVSTISGGGPTRCFFADGLGAAANFQFPEGVAYDSSTGNLYVTDTANQTVRQIQL